MRIAIVTLNFPTAKGGIAGGVERTIFYLRKIFFEAGFEVETIDRFRLNKDYKGTFWDLRRLGVYKLSYDLGRYFSKRRKHYDLVLCEGLSGWNIKFSPAINVYHGNTAAYIEIIKNGVSILIYLKTKYLDVFFERLSGQGKIVVSVSKSTAEEVKRYYKLKTHTVIENAVDTDLFKPRAEKNQLRKKFGLPTNQFLGLFVGRAKYAKGIDILQKIAPQLDNETSLVIVISGKKIALKKSFCLCNVPYIDMPLLYSACDFFILPSRYEGFGLSFIEAMATELPILITRVGHAQEISRKEPRLAEFILKDLNPDLFVKKINQLKKSEKLRRELGKIEREYVLKNNSLEIFKEKWLNLVRSLVADKR